MNSVTPVLNNKISEIEEGNSSNNFVLVPSGDTEDIEDTEDFGYASVDLLPEAKETDEAKLNKFIDSLNIIGKWGSNRELAVKDGSLILVRWGKEGRGLRTFTFDTISNHCVPGISTIVEDDDGQIQALTVTFKFMCPGGDRYVSYDVHGKQLKSLLAGDGCMFVEGHINPPSKPVGRQIIAELIAWSRNNVKGFKRLKKPKKDGITENGLYLNNFHLSPDGHVKELPQAIARIGEECYKLGPISQITADQVKNFDQYLQKFFSVFPGHLAAPIFAGTLAGFAGYNKGTLMLYGAPGTGKTFLARNLGLSLVGDFNSINHEATANCGDSTKRGLDKLMRNLPHIPVVLDELGEIKERGALEGIIKSAFNPTDAYKLDCETYDLANRGEIVHCTTIATSNTLPIDQAVLDRCIILHFEHAYTSIFDKLESKEQQQAFLQFGTAFIAWIVTMKNTPDFESQCEAWLVKPSIANQRKARMLSQYQLGASLLEAFYAHHGIKSDTIEYLRNGITECGIEQSTYQEEVNSDYLSRFIEIVKRAILESRGRFTGSNESEFSNKIPTIAMKDGKDIFIPFSAIDYLKSIYKPELAHISRALLVKQCIDHSYFRSSKDGKNRVQKRFQGIRTHGIIFPNELYDHEDTQEPLPEIQQVPLPIATTHFAISNPTPILDTPLITCGDKKIVIAPAYGIVSQSMKDVTVFIDGDWNDEIKARFKKDHSTAFPIPHQQGVYYYGKDNAITVIFINARENPEEIRAFVKEWGKLFSDKNPRLSAQKFGEEQLKHSGTRSTRIGVRRLNNDQLKIVKRVVRPVQASFINTDIINSYPYLGYIDMNSAYLWAMQDTKVGYGELREVSEYTPNVPGVYDISNAFNMPTTLAVPEDDGTGTVTGAMLGYLIDDLKLEITVECGWIFESSHDQLGQFAKAMTEYRSFARLKNLPLVESYIKDAYVKVYGWLNSVKKDTSTFYYPHIYQEIKDRGAIAIDRTARTINNPVGIHVDAIYFGIDNSTDYPANVSYDPIVPGCFKQQKIVQNPKNISDILQLHTLFDDVNAKEEG